MDVSGNVSNGKRLIPLYKQPWHGSYKSMMDRCYRKTAENFYMYGGRGIKVCDEWFFNPYAFGEWAENNGFQNGLTIERKDVNGNYCPENCTWATPKQQANNRRNTIFLEWNGQRKSVHEWADELGVSASTLKNRYYRGWSVEEIMTLSVSRRKPRRGEQIMCRLIDANALMSYMDECSKESRFRVYYGYAKSFIDDAPTIDAVPIVRCEKCVLHGNCITEDSFALAGIKNPFCCVGKQKEGAD